MTGMMVANHSTLFSDISIGKIEELKAARYLVTTTRNGSTVAIFYADVAHPEGSRYFGLYYNHYNKLYICNGDWVEDAEFDAISNDDGTLFYSQHRHDYVLLDNGNMIDGGREYTRSSGCPIWTFKIKDGAFAITEPEIVK